MILLTCAATGHPLYINPKKIIALEDAVLELGAASFPVTRVWIGAGDDEYFPVKETPNTILATIRRTRYNPL